MSSPKEIRSLCPGEWRVVIKRTVPVVFVFLVLLSTALLPLDTLQLWDVKHDKLILCLPAAAGECFTLSYTHSSELSAVSDFFRVDGTEIVLFESRFQSVNTGLPSSAERNEILRIEGDCFKLCNRDIRMSSFDFWAEAKYANRLVLAGADFDVPALLGGPGGKALVRLTISRISLGRLIWNHLLT